MTKDKTTCSECENKLSENDLRFCLDCCLKYSENGFERGRQKERERWRRGIKKLKEEIRDCDDDYQSMWNLIDNMLYEILPKEEQENEKPR